MTTDQHYALVSHYMSHGRFVAFDVPTEVTQGSGITVPTDYLWTYVSSPQTEYSPGVITATVELEATPQYTAVPGYIF